MTNMNIEAKTNRRGSRATWSAVAIVLVLISPSVKPLAQSFSSGSDGSDGALIVAANQGTVIFDPADAARWGRTLDTDGDGVYNFTTITIGAGSTIKLQGDKINRPVFWLAIGDVVINGAIDLSGGAGGDTRDLSLRRLLAVPGSGGYPGGAGGLVSGTPPATPGEGPGGGSGGVTCFGDLRCGRGGTFSGNRYLLPLVGGSGGEGFTSGDSYRNGGAGGGAILISSSTLITVAGTISSNGGSTQATGAGGGSGGGLRLVAPTISGGGHLSVSGGVASGGSINGGNGLVRLEAFQISGSLVFDSGGAFVTRGSPVDPGTLRPASSIRVTAIDGIPVPPNSSGSFLLPDVTISKNAAVNVDIEATGIPPGTVVTLQVYPQTPTDLTVVNLPTSQATLSGTLQSSTATAIFAFPYGFSRGFVRATWTQ
jgi:hypothetical protein